MYVKMKKYQHPASLKKTRTYPADFFKPVASEAQCHLTVRMHRERHCCLAIRRAATPENLGTGSSLRQIL